MSDEVLRAHGETMSIRDRWNMLIVSTGGALETFDFIIYGFFAKEIGREFFPATSGISAVMLSFAVFAIGYVSRPLGGALLGRIGDKYGRRPAFAASAMVGAVATLTIGLLPTYATCGSLAPLLLVLLRLVQGVCVGGELPGAVVYAVETTHTKPGLLCGMVFFAVNLALLAAAGINLGVQAMLTETQAAQYGWRTGFIAGGGVGLLSFALRRTIRETSAFAQFVGTRRAEPLAELVHAHLGKIAAGVAATMVVGASNGLFVAYMPAYLRNLGYVPREIASAQALYVIVLTACMLVTGAVSDVLPRRYVFRTGAVLSGIFAPFFYLALSSTHADLVAWFIPAALVASFANGTFACAIAEMFPIGVRYSGVGIALNLGVAVTMGTAPLVATVLIALTHWRAAPCLFMLLCAGLALIASFSLKQDRPPS